MQPLHYAARHCSTAQRQQRPPSSVTFSKRLMACSNSFWDLIKLQSRWGSWGEVSSTCPPGFGNLSDETSSLTAARFMIRSNNLSPISIQEHIKQVPSAEKDIWERSIVQVDERPFGFVCLCVFARVPGLQPTFCCFATAHYGHTQ